MWDFKVGNNANIANFICLWKPDCHFFNMLESVATPTPIDVVELSICFIV